MDNNEQIIKDLEERIEDLSDFIENASLPLHWVDGAGTIVWANKIEMDSLGYSKEEYIGHHIAEFHADQKTINDILTRLTNNETLRNYEAKLKCKDGSIKDVLINSNVRWKDGNFLHTRCFTRDITDLKKEQAHKEQLVLELKEKNRTLSDLHQKVQGAYEDLETKVKFRTLQLEKQIRELESENSKLKGQK